MGASDERWRPCDHGPQASPPPPILPAARAFLVQWPWPLFSQLFTASVPLTRPIVAVIEADATDRRTLCSLLSSLDADVQDYDSAESYLAVARRYARLPDHRHVRCPACRGSICCGCCAPRDTSPPVILLGEETDVRAAVDAMREGAVGLHREAAHGRGDSCAASRTCSITRSRSVTESREIALRRTSMSICARIERQLALHLLVQLLAPAACRPAAARSSARRIDRPASGPAGRGP